MTLMGCREAIFVDKSTIDFPIFLLFFNTKFPIFPVFSILSFLFSYFPIFLSNHAAGHPATNTSTFNNSHDLFPELYHRLSYTNVSDLSKVLQHALHTVASCSLKKVQFLHTIKPGFDCSTSPTSRVAPQMTHILCLDEFK